MEKNSAKNQKPYSTNSSGQAANQMRFGSVSPQQARDKKQQPVSEFGDTVTLSRHIRKSDIQVQVESATVPRRSTQTNGSQLDFSRNSPVRVSRTSQNALKEKSVLGYSTNTKNLDKQTEVSFAKTVGAQFSTQISQTLTVGESSVSDNQSQFRSVGSFPDSVFNDEITDVEISDIFDSDLISGDECDGPVSASSLGIDPPPSQQTVYAEYVHHIVLDYSTILEKNIKMKENIEVLHSSGKTESVLRSLLRIGKKDKRWRRTRSVDPPTANSTASDTPSTKNKSIVATFLRRLSPKMTRKAKKSKTDKEANKSNGVDGILADEVTIEGNSSSGILRERNGSLSSTDNTSESQQSRRASAASSTNPSPLLSALSRDSYQKLMIIKDNKQKDKSIYSTFKEKQQPLQKGKETVTPKLGALRVIEFADGGTLDSTAGLQSSCATNPPSQTTVLSTDHLIPSIQSSDLSCNDPDLVTPLKSVILKGAPQPRITVPESSCVVSPWKSSEGNYLLPASAESDQTMNTVGPRPAVCSWSQNGVVVKEAKSGAVKSYTSDGSLFSDRCSSTAIASDSQAVTSEISSSPAGMSSPLEVDVRNGSSPGEPSPKVPSYVRLSASASGYGGNSSYSSLPRLGKSRQPLSISNSPPRDVLPTGRQADGGDIYLLNIDASANTGGEGRTVDGGKENGPYVSHDELGQSMSDRLVKSSVNSASENVVVTSSTSDKNCTRERGRPSSIVIQNERSRPSSTLVKSERSRPSSTVEQNGSSTEEAMLDNTRVEDVTLVVDNISEATAYTDLHGSLEKDGHYYLKLVELEKSSLDGLCRLAQEDISRDLPEEILGKLWSAIGKATLLTTKKFKQCRELCYQNINGPEPDHPVTLSSDLEGYWELVSIQLKEVHDTFAEIDKLRQNNWIDDTPPPQPPYISPPTSPVRKTPAKKAVSARVKLPPRQPIQKRIQAARMNSANNAAARRAAAVNEDNRLTDKQQSNLEVVLPAGGLQLDSPSLFPSAIANETDNFNASSSEDVIAEELNSNSRALVDVTISGGVS